MIARIRRQMAIDNLWAHFGDDALPLVRRVDRMTGASEEEVIFETATAVFAVRAAAYLIAHRNPASVEFTENDATLLKRLSRHLRPDTFNPIDGSYWSSEKWSLAIQLADEDYRDFIMGEFWSQPRNALLVWNPDTYMGMPVADRALTAIDVLEVMYPITEQERCNKRAALKRQSEWRRLRHLEALERLKEMLDSVSPVLWGNDPAAYMGRRRGRSMTHDAINEGVQP